MIIVYPYDYIAFIFFSEINVIGITFASLTAIIDFWVL